MSGDGNVNVSEEALGVQVPRLDLKNVSDGDKWEGNFHPLARNIASNEKENIWQSRSLHSFL